jgi:hypothetical protein
MFVTGAFIWWNRVVGPRRQEIRRLSRHGRVARRPLERERPVRL